MKLALVFALIALTTTEAAQAFSEEDDGASMTLHCSYTVDMTPAHTETATIGETTAEDAGQSAAVMNFSKGGKSRSVAYVVKVGEFAECSFPSGNRVRVKVGEHPGRPYGQCGASGEVFASVWVNERKLASSVWFSGHCIEEDGSPSPSFRFAGGPNPSLQRCSSARVDSAATESGDPPSAQTAKEPLTVCLDYPDIALYPKDELEYPPPGKTAPVVGTVELLTGSDDVCTAALAELNSDFNTFGRYANENVMKLERPKWGKPSAALPDHVNEENESVFDYDNDGNLDSVLRGDSETLYMDAVDLVVRFGSSPTRLQIADPPADAETMLIPCQMDSIRHKAEDCPPASQIADEAGFQMKGRIEKESVFFRARYAMVAPFEFEGSNFIGVASNSGDTEDYVAILRPMPKRGFRQMCLFRRVTENF
jgi:hypothetical protein